MRWPGNVEPSDVARPIELNDLRAWVGVARHEISTESVGRFWSAISRGGQGAHVHKCPLGPGTLVPPTYFCPDPVAEVEKMGFKRPTDPPNSIDGGSEWFPGHPLRIGDSVTSVGRVVDVERRQTHDGRALVETRVEVQSWNQKGLLVGSAIGTILNYEARSDER